MAVWTIFGVILGVFGPFLDYDSLRLGGLVVAAIFFVLGILLILSEKCPEISQIIPKAPPKISPKHPKNIP
uniref:FXYD domain-containing ion transport regulator n=1 Tax=Ficedula albicollis TaxID=59894 RepID=A0A803WFJ4_FICAL